MTKNLGKSDRMIRMVVGFVFIYLGVFNAELVNDQLSASILIVMGIVSLLVVFVGSCPLYALIGLNTCGKK